MDQDLVLTAEVEDAEDPPSALRVSWTVDGEPLADPQLVNVDGIASTTGRITSAGDHEIVATAFDSAGVGGSDSITVTIRTSNQPPTCGITEPDDGIGLALDAPALLLGFATDPDDGVHNLRVDWRSDIDGFLGNEGPDAVGEIRQVIGGLSPGEHALSLTVDDRVGGECSDVHVLTVSNRPTAAIDLPLNGATVEDDDPVLLSGTVADVEDAAEQLAVTWTSSLDGELASPAADPDGRVEAVVPSLSEGHHVLELVVLDSAGVTGRDSVEIDVVAAAR